MTIMDCPEPRPVHTRERGKVIAWPEVGASIITMNHKPYERARSEGFDLLM
jgi:hypothetical protein